LLSSVSANACVNVTGTWIVIVFALTLYVAAPTVHWLFDSVALNPVPALFCSISVCVCA
jgi:hypothetical protein